MSVRASAGSGSTDAGGSARAAASAAVRATTTPAGAMTEAPTSIRRADRSAATWYAGRTLPVVNTSTDAGTPARSSSVASR